MSEKECMPGFTVPNETLHKKIQEVRTQLYRMRLAHPDQNIAEKVNELMKAREVLIRLMGIMSINVEKRLFGINWYPLAALIGWLEGTGIKWKISSIVVVGIC